MFVRAVGLIALVATAACSNLSDVDPDGCGNLVTNAGEDCDGFSLVDGDGTVCGEPGTENECSFVCDEESAGLCPDGWGCGGDGACRRASGGFEQASGSPWRFSVQDFGIGDVDGDGNDDLIGNDVATVTVRFGDSDGEFTTDLDVRTPQPQGPVTFAHFSNDELLDILVPMAGGMFVMLGGEERDLVPVAYAPFSLGDIGDAGVGAVVLESIGGDLNSEIMVMVGNGMIFLNSVITTPVFMPSPFDVTDLSGRIPTANIDDDIEQRNEMALAFAGDDQVFLYTSTGGPIGPQSNNLQVSPFTPSPVINLPPSYAVQFGTFLADVDGQAGLDLMVSVRNTLTNESRIAVSLNNGAGVLQNPAVVRPIFDRTNGSSPWPLAAGDLNEDGKADYVFAEAIAIADFDGDAIPPPPGIPTSLFPTAFAIGQQWGEATIGDFNGDDHADVATVIESTDGVDFLLGVNATGFFNTFHVDTEEPPRSLRVGDFDGDFIMDVAFAESGFGLQPDGVSAIYGDIAGGPDEAVSMGALGFVDVIEPTSFVVSADTLDAISDLFVLSSAFPDRDAKAVAILFGSSSRRMLAPFSFSPPVDVENPNPEPDNPRRIMVGEFSDIAEGILDVVAVTEVGIDVTDPEGTSAGAGHMWRVAGEGGEGGLDPEDAGFVDLPAPEVFHAACSVWTSGDLDGDGLHEVIGIDNSLGRDFTCFGFGFSPAGRLMVGSIDEANPGTPITTSIEEVPGALRAVRDAALLDMDADGDLDLLAVFAGETRGNVTGDAPDGAGVAVVWNDGGTLDVAGMSVIDAGAAVFDAGALAVDDTGVPALVILADRRVLMVHFDVDARVYGAPEPLIDQKGDGRLEVGDVNADGVQDFAFTVGSEVHVMLGVPHDPIGGAP